jgi:PTH1 family peptidyl-tRNA hydrolase
MIVEAYAKKNKLEWREDKKSKSGVTTTDTAVFITPDTYMNKSGSALVGYVKSVNAAHKTVVIYDDMDLPLGRIKMSYNRSSGGHNGLKSIERALKTQEFWRIRVGVSSATPGGKLKKPSGEEAVIKFILGSFTPAQRETFKKISKQVLDTIEIIISDGPERAMNTINTIS